MEYHVGENIDCQFEMFARKNCIKTGRLSLSKSVEEPADSIDFLGNLKGASLLCAFKKHVLQKMCEASFTPRDEVTPGVVTPGVATPGGAPLISGSTAEPKSNANGVCGIN